ncbi:MAG: thioredoxin family protein [Bacteroidales bacterium]|nr:thioredoxin family protein [Bacteroidales bacterium]
MKQLKIYICFLLFILYSCHSSTENQAFKSVTITGKIIDFKPENTEVRIFAPKLCIEDKIETITIDSLGQFTYSFINNIPSDIRIIANKANFLIFTHPGDNINIEFEYGKLDFWSSISVTGARSFENELIINFQKYITSNSIDLKDIEEARDNMSETLFISFMNSVQSESMRLCKKFMEDHNFSKEIESWTKWYASKLYYHYMYWFPIYRNDIEIGNDFYRFQEKLLPINKDMIAATYNLNLFIPEYFAGSIKSKIIEENMEFFNQIDENNLKADSIFMEGIIEHSKGEFTKELVLCYWLSSKINAGNIKPYEKFIATIEHEISTTFLKENLDQLYHSTKSKIENPSKTIVLADIIKEKSIKNILDTIFEINRNKVIVIDCWGTYCSPCIEKFPKMKQLFNFFEGQNIEFVYFCLNGTTNYKRWQNLVKIYELGGIHYCLDKKQSTDLKRILEIKGIPHYAIYDKSGKLIKDGYINFGKNDLTELINE